MEINPDTHYQTLKKMAKEQQIPDVDGKTRQELLQALSDKPSLITEATPEVLKTFNIGAQTIRLDKLRSDLQVLQASPIRGRVNSFKDGRHHYTIDEHEMTIHFFGGCLGPQCQTLHTSDKAIIYQALKYLGANTVAGKDLMLEYTN